MIDLNAVANAALQRERDTKAENERLRAQIEILKGEITRLCDDLDRARRVPT